MKEHPILFSGPMVRAILEGRKTQTRRVIKPQPGHKQVHDWNGKRLYDGEHRLWWWKDQWWDIDWEMQRSLLSFCPYGQPGDLLWVRESCWICIDNNDRPRPVADGPAPTTEIRNYHIRPSIFMPRTESRLTLRITDVRVQRLQEISEGDAEAEGIFSVYEFGMPRYKWPDCFAALWDSINAKRGYSWEMNPWVWAISFKREP